MINRQATHEQKIKIEEAERIELSADRKDKSHSEILIKARRVPKDINLNLK